MGIIRKIGSIALLVGALASGSSSKADTAKIALQSYARPAITMKAEPLNYPEPSKYQPVPMAYEKHAAADNSDPPEDDDSHLDTLLALDDDILPELPIGISLQGKPRKDDADENLEALNRSAKGIEEARERYMHKRRVMSLSEKHSAEPEDDSAFPLEFIGKASLFGSKDMWRGAANEKIILGDQYGIMAYGQQALQQQKLTDGDLPGHIQRYGLSGFLYVPLEDAVAFAELGGEWEGRDFKFKPDNGNDFKFGNRTAYVFGKLGYAKGGVFNQDEDAFDQSQTKILVTAAHGNGDMTGDIEGNHKVTRATANLQQMLVPRLYFVAGGGYQRENLGDNWVNKIASAEAGLRYDFLNENGIFEVKGTYRDMESIVNDIASRSRHLGGQGAAGFVLFPWLKARVVGGFEGKDGDVDGMGGYGLIELLPHFSNKK